MIEASSPGTRFRAAVANNQPLQVVGTINAFTARMAERAGHQAIYLSGGGVAANSLGLPDLGGCAFGYTTRCARGPSCTMDIRPAMLKSW